MKSILIMIVVLLSGDLALFSGTGTKAAWATARHQLQSLQHYADDATGSLMRR